MTDDRESAAATVASQRRLTPQQVLESPYFLLGSIDAIIAQVEALRAHIVPAHEFLASLPSSGTAPPASQSATEVYGLIDETSAS